MFGHVINYRGGLGTIEQAAAATDELDFTYALRDRQIIESRKTDPIALKREAVLKKKGVFRFLRDSRGRGR